MDDTQKAMYATVALVCQELSDIELAVLNNVAQADFNPRGRLFDYERVKHLFTEADGTRMHEDTKQALADVVLHRLEGGAAGPPRGGQGL